MEKRYIAFFEDVGQLDKPVQILYKKADGTYHLKGVPIYLSESMAQYEERTGNRFCYELDQEEAQNAPEAYVVDQDHLTKLYVRKKNLMR